MGIRRRCTALGIAAAIGLTSVGLSAPALATPGSDYPSWADVQSARADTAATQAEVTRLQGLLSGLQSAADAAGIAALQAGEAAQVAQQNLAEAQATVDSLAARLEAARTAAAQSSRNLGSLAAQLARSGGAGVGVGTTLLTESGDSADLLYRLGTMEKLSSGQTALITRATQTANEVDSLEAQAAVAASARRDAAARAESTSAAASRAASEADAALAGQQEHAATLQTQLEFLQDGTATLEQKFAEGEQRRRAAEAEAAAQRAAAVQAAREAAAARPTTPAPRPPASGGGSTPPVVTPPAGGGAPVGPSSAATSAVSFALAQVGKWYVLGGEGPSMWDCSGLTMIAYRQAGVNIGYHTVGAQYRQMTAVGRLRPVSGGMVPGDLLFYGPGGGTNSQAMYHTTMYIGNGQMVEAPQPGERVKVSPVRTHNLVPMLGRPAG
ncbi:C40 family peptidase [Mycetocola spongiae]|uniref:C40 family peptidase n=1 Tax=Mycetocola spongiae TaxID=2859226 RepID=UPI001CF398FD|nr:C40 family peptidase [Mycetocola spongiae]UCR89634.1 C40 family peptidase [Mycetocola spongiae]